MLKIVLSILLGTKEKHYKRRYDSWRDERTEIASYSSSFAFALLFQQWISLLISITNFNSRTNCFLVPGMGMPGTPTSHCKYFRILVEYLMCRVSIDSLIVWFVDELGNFDREVRNWIRKKERVCNSPSLLLVDIVRFDPIRIVVSITVLKRVY